MACVLFAGKIVERVGFFVSHPGAEDWLLVPTFHIIHLVFDELARMVEEENMTFIYLVPIRCLSTFISWISGSLFFY